MPFQQVNFMKRIPTSRTAILVASCFLACLAPMAVLAAPTLPTKPMAGTWLTAAADKNAMEETLKTSIGTLRFVDVDDKDGIHTNVSLNGKRIQLWNDSSMLSIVRVLDFGGQIDVVFFSSCSGSSYECHKIPAAAHLDRAGRVNSSINLEHHPIMGGEDGESPPDWIAVSDRQTTLLERQGNRVREAQLLPDRVRSEIRAGRPDELVALKAIESVAAADWCDDLYSELETCATGERNECAELQPKDPTSLSAVLKNADTPWGLIPERGRVADVAFPLDRYVEACSRACATHKVPDKKTFMASICKQEK
jgi:hypothetical protein